jgi:dolichol-phosphate mannosyltransferase
MSTERLRMVRERPEADDASPRVAVVIPALNVEAWIGDVLAGIPAWVALIVVVDDGSSDGTPEVIRQHAARDPRIAVERHPRRLGVTAAMVSGIRIALRREADVVVKMDGDGQMDPAYLPSLLRPIFLGQADCTKGNRFHYSGNLRAMPRLRQAGNLALSFLAKAAVGYWNIFDPTNGYVAVRAELLRSISLQSIRGYYFFETALLAELYLLGAVVKDIPMPAIYRGEPSHLRVGRVLWEYPWRLLGIWLRRVGYHYFLLDFSLVSLYLVAGLILLLGGLGYGGASWWYFARSGVGAPTGTVVLPAMMIILGVQLLLAAMAGDVQAVPREPCLAPRWPAVDRLLAQWERESGGSAERPWGPR